MDLQNDTVLNNDRDPVTGDPVDKVLIREQDERDARNNTSVDLDKKQKAREFAQRAVARWRVMSESEQLQRKRSLEEVEFNSGKHWDDGMREERDAKDRVVIEINRTPQYLAQVANAQRMSRPSILVKPNGNGADEDGAQVQQGIIRSIERKSDAESIRDDAFYGMLEKGWDYYRVNVEYESEKSNRKVIKTARIYNPFSVYCDPAAVMPDKTDAQDWIITDDMPVDEYRNTWPDSVMASLEFNGEGDEVKDWMGQQTIRVAEYWYKKRTREKLFTLADDPYGDGAWEDELAQDDDGKLVGVFYVGDEPAFRWSMRTKIFWALINAVEVLDGSDDQTEGREFVEKAKYIPIIPVIGRRIMWDRRYIYTGMVRDAMAPCLAADYWLSAITEMVALGPKAPWVVAYDAIAQYREMWDQSNIENYAALYYDKFDAEGREMPVPFRNFGEPPIQAMTFILNYAEEDLKRVMGIYNRSLGAEGPEHSGVAIEKVQREADVANFNYIDNAKRAEELESKIYLDLMPKVLIAPQVIEITRTDNQAEKIWINKEFKDPKSGKVKINDLTKGNYDVEVEIGPSMSTRREAAAQGILDYLQVDKEAAPLVGYLLARNMDFPDKNELERVLKGRAIKMGADVQDDNGEQPDIPEQFKVQYQQMSTQLETQTKLLESLQEKFKDKSMEYQHQIEMKAIELASQERQTSAKINAQIVTSEMAAKSKADIEMIKAAIAQVAIDLQALRGPGPADSPSTTPQQAQGPEPAQNPA